MVGRWDCRRVEISLNPLPPLARTHRNKRLETNIRPAGLWSVHVPCGFHRYLKTTVTVTFRVQNYIT